MCVCVCLTNAAVDHPFKAPPHKKKHIETNKNKENNEGHWHSRPQVCIQAFVHVTLGSQFTSPYMRVGWGLVALLIRLEANSFMDTPRTEILPFQSGFQLKRSSDRESSCVSQKQSEKQYNHQEQFLVLLSRFFCFCFFALNAPATVSSGESFP